MLFLIKCVCTCMLMYVFVRKNFNRLIYLRIILFRNISRILVYFEHFHIFDIMTRLLLNLTPNASTTRFNKDVYHPNEILKGKFNFGI
jgi:hypothetical protein